MGIMITHSLRVFVEVKGDEEHTIFSLLLGHGKPARVASRVLKERCTHKETAFSRVVAIDSTEEINYYREFVSI